MYLLCLLISGLYCYHLRPELAVEHEELLVGRVELVVHIEFTFISVIFVLVIKLVENIGVAFVAVFGVIIVVLPAKSVIIAVVIFVIVKAAADEDFNEVSEFILVFVRPITQLFLTVTIFIIIYEGVQSTF